MATFTAQKADAPAFAPVTGGAVCLTDRYAVAANFTAGDDIRLVRIPAGTQVALAFIRCDDLDTNGTPTIVFRVGYQACDSGSALVANTTYFAAAGQTTAQAGGTLTCTFEPITFEEDVWLTVTVNTASATFAAGDICGTVIGSHNGAK